MTLPNTTNAGIGLLLDSDVQARAGGVNSMYRCNFYNTASFVFGAARGVVLNGASDETSGRHPAFVSFHGLHVRHDNGDALYLESADDVLFADYGVSKGAGGTGLGIHIKPKVGALQTFVAGITFLQITVGSNDSPTIRIDSQNAKGICFYGVQGVDSKPALVLVNNAFEPIFQYAGTLLPIATKDGISYSPPIKIDGYAIADDRTLDIYKERTFTPIVYFGGANVGVTTSAAVGRATRVGDMVKFTIIINLTSKGTSVGNFQIGGLPWTISTSPSTDIPNVRLGNVNTTLTQWVFARISTTNIFVEKLVSGSAVLLNDTDLTATSTIWLSGTYFTDSTTV